MWSCREGDVMWCLALALSAPWPQVSKGLLNLLLLGSCFHDSQEQILLSQVFTCFKYQLALCPEQGSITGANAALPRLLQGEHQGLYWCRYCIGSAFCLTVWHLPSAHAVLVEYSSMREGSLRTCTQDKTAAWENNPSGTSSMVSPNLNLNTRV